MHGHRNLKLHNISFTFSKLQHYLWVIHNPDLLMWLRISVVTENKVTTKPCTSRLGNLDADQPSAENQLLLDSGNGGCRWSRSNTFEISNTFNSAINDHEFNTVLPLFYFCSCVSWCYFAVFPPFCNIPPKTKDQQRTEIPDKIFLEDLHI